MVGMVRRPQGAAMKTAALREGQRLRRAVKEAAARWLSANDVGKYPAEKFKQANENWERWVAKNIDDLMVLADAALSGGKSK